MPSVPNECNKAKKPTRADYVRKLREAEYFLGHMRPNEQYDQPFQYNLSAFLTAARSVLQYARKEVCGTPNQQWYDEWSGSNDLVKRMAHQRDDNIHAKTPDPGRMYQYTAAHVEGLWVPLRAPVKWYFRDWGDEPIVELCDRYLKQIWHFVSEGAERGYIGTERGQPIDELKDLK
jgi:hypothetical protein